jgi:hypothetical protein
MKVDIAGDEQQVQALKEKVANDQAKMQSDIKQCGKNSTEVKADAAALKADREQARTLRRDLKHDEHIVDKVDERAARNLKTDTAELKTLGEQMQDEHAKLSSDGQKYGRDSAQVKADEASMTRMQQEASGLRNHIHKDNVQLSRLGGGGRRH